MENKKKILVVDDEDIIRTILEIVLTEENYEVFCAGDGRTAVENIENDHFDLVLLDIRMRGMDGIQTLKKIRDINKDVKVIIMSASLDNGDIEEARDFGLSSYVEKPFKLNDIRRVIRETLSN